MTSDRQNSPVQHKTWRGMRSTAPAGEIAKFSSRNSLIRSRPCPPTVPLLAVTFDDAARALSVDRQTIEQSVATNQLPVVFIGSHAVIPVAALEQFLQYHAEQNDPSRD